MSLKRAIECWSPCLPACSEAVRWLGKKAEDVGVEVFPGFAGAKVVYGPSGEVSGVQVRCALIGTRPSTFPVPSCLPARLPTCSCAR